MERTTAFGRGVQTVIANGWHGRKSAGNVTPQTLLVRNFEPRLVESHVELVDTHGTNLPLTS